MTLALPSRTPPSPEPGSGEAALLEPLSATLGRIYEAYFPVVWRTLRRLGLSETQAEDGAQDVFLVVHRRLGDFEGRSTMSTWLIGIALRVAQQHRRKGARSSLEEPSVFERLPSAGRGPEADVDAVRARETLYRLLGELKEPLRDAFVLLELEELSGREAAELLGISENTVYSRLRLARERLRTALRAEQRKETG